MFDVFLHADLKSVDLDLISAVCSACCKNVLVVISQ